MSAAVQVDEKKIKRLITIVSIVIPVAVAALFGIKIPNVAPLRFLPPIYATINGLTAVLLVFAVWAIKNKNRKLHNRLINVCIGLSLSFLLMYIAYHMTSDSTVFGGEGWIKPVYYFILITHIVLSILVIPLVLRTYAAAYLGDWKKHRKMSKLTFPVWLYVAVTGVVVYLMISPYYA